MTEIALLLWFLLLTFGVTLAYQNKIVVEGWWIKIREEQAKKQENLFEHPLLKWPARIFLVLTIIAWLDFILWGITSVFPLAIVLFIWGGSKALKEASPFLLTLAFFWVVSRLLFNLSPMEFVENLSVDFLSEVYGLPSTFLQFFVIPLAILFFLGIASLIWRKHVTWGILSLLLSTWLPFVLGLIFKGTEHGMGAGAVTWLADFYNVDLGWQKILLLPQVIFVFSGVSLLFHRRTFAGLSWLLLGTLLPILLVPLREMYMTWVAQTPEQSFLSALSSFYGTSLFVVKISILLQVCLLLSSFVLALRGSTLTGIFLLASSLFLPWIISISQGVPPRLQELTQDMSFADLAQIYHCPSYVLEVLFVPMIFSVVLGTIFLVAQKNFAGSVLVFFGFSMPKTIHPLHELFLYLEKVDASQMSSWYQISSQELSLFLFPMIVLIVFGLIAMNSERKFWGGVLCSFGLFLPWLMEPFHKISQLAQNNYPLVFRFYPTEPSQLLLYAPAMVLFFAGGFLQLTVKNRFTYGLILIGASIYLPFWLPFFVKSL